MQEFNLKNLYNSISSDLDSTDFEWVQFIQDHYDYIKDNSQTLVLDPKNMNVMQYRLTDFLKQNSINPEIAWIVLMVNQLKSDKDFHNLQYLIVPSITLITKLRTTFDSTQAHKKRQRNELN